MSVTLTPFAGLDNTNVENPEALYLVAGSGTDLDGKLVRAVALVDPATGAAMVPGSVTFTSLSMADGSDVAQGATTDAASAPTVIGLLKALNAALGLTTDDDTHDTAIGHLQKIQERLGNLGDDGSGTALLGRVQHIIDVLAAPAVPVAAQTASYSTTGAGATVDATDEPVLAFSLQVTSVSAGTLATSWTVLVEGSLDGANWATILTHTKLSEGEGGIKHTVGFPVNYLRANVSALVLGAEATAISVSILGKS